LVDDTPSLLGPQSAPSDGLQRHNPLSTIVHIRRLCAVGHDLE
jgi:hypothetical protein